MRITLALLTLVLLLERPCLAVTDGPHRPRDVTLSEVVELHDNALQSFHSLDVTLEMYLNDSYLGTFRYTKKGDIERFRGERLRMDQGDGVVNKALSRPLSTKNWHDMLRDGKTEKMLLQWDPKGSIVLEPLANKGVKGYEQPQARNLSSAVFDGPAALLLWPQMCGGDDRRTLKELVHASPEAKLIGTSEVGGSQTWHVRVKHPGLANHTGNDYIDVYIDKSHNYMIRRIVGHNEWRRLDGVVVPFEFQRDVVQFQECSGDLYFPTEIIEKGGVGQDVKNSRGKVTNLVVNAPLSEDALAFHWPKNLLMRKGPANEDNRVPQYLMGDNDKAIFEVKSADDVTKLRARYGLPDGQQPASESAKSTARLFRNALVLVVFPLLLFAMGRRLYRGRQS